MLWPALTASAGNHDPLSSAISQILGYGVLGIVALALAFRFLVPRGAVDDARTEARTDLLTQVERLEKQIEDIRRDKRDAEEARDDALKFTQQNLVPLLLNFTNATTALLPILQDIVRHREAADLDFRRRNR